MNSNSEFCISCQDKTVFHPSMTFLENQALNVEQSILTLTWCCTRLSAGSSSLQNSQGSMMFSRLLNRWSPLSVRWWFSSSSCSLHGRHITNASGLHSISPSSASPSFSLSLSQTGSCNSKIKENPHPSPPDKHIVMHMHTHTHKHEWKLSW